MLRAARRIIGYAKDTTRENLASTPMRLDAVLYEIVVIGEAARQAAQPARA
ncbi:MAG: HepT-like ribonuclease domain-containing protein [Anaerolineae bacterium]